MLIKNSIPWKILFSNEEEAKTFSIKQELGNIFGVELHYKNVKGASSDRNNILNKTWICWKKMDL